MLNLDGRVALVSGASRGIGRATAAALAAAGARVAMLARGQEELAAAAREVGGMALSADVADPAAVRAAVESVRSSWGWVTILVNNAGRPGDGRIDELSWEDWRSVMDVNVGGPMLLSQAVIPGMVEAGGGDIINIASGAALRGYAGMSAYCASKFALRGLGQSLAEEWGGQGVRVTTLCPGSVEGDFGTSYRKAKQAVATPAAGARLLRPEDVAEAVVDVVRQGPRAWTAEWHLWPFRAP